jgi:hypothetical protein
MTDFKSNPVREKRQTFKRAQRIQNLTENKYKELSECHLAQIASFIVLHELLLRCSTVTLIRKSSLG